MSRFIQFFLLLSIGWTARSQNIPQVPSKMQLGDMKLTITEGGRRDIQKDVDMLRSSDRYFKIKLDRVVLYMPIVERILKEENIPDDIKYLAIQESAFIPDAVSSSKAVGFWQFKDFTAREVGMRVDNKVDERKNIVSSTHGAAEYFRSHQKQLDNWAHTVTAHMTGAAGIKKYVNDKDYGAKKMTITKKSHWYLKRFLAHKIAFQDELKYKNSQGLELVEYKKGAGKDLKRISKDFKVDEADLKEYNKWLIHGKIPGDKRYVVVVPVKKGNRKAHELAKSSELPKRKTIEDPKPEDAASTAVVYPEAFGDTFVRSKGPIIQINGVKAVIARQRDDFGDLLERAGLREKKFFKFNDLGSKPTVKPGDIYFIKRKKTRSPMGFYVVKDQESLWEVSQKFGIRLKDLRRKNRMGPYEEVRAGRVLWLNDSRPAKVPIEYRAVNAIPKPEIAAIETPINDSEPSSEIEIQAEPEPEVIQPSEKPDPVDENFSTHVVQQGETLWKISKMYDDSVEDLREWNNLKTGAGLSIGQKILVTGKLETPPVVPDPKPTPPVKKSKTHIVRGGETLYAIAKRYHVEVDQILKWNNLKSGAGLSIGQELTLFGEKESQPDVSPTKEKKDTQIHVVKAGETLYGISRKYQVSSLDIQQWNNLSGNGLSIGQELVIGDDEKSEIRSESTDQPKDDSTRIHVVEAGETLYGIARKYNMKLDELKKLNNKTSNDLTLGEELKVKP